MLDFDLYLDQVHSHAPWSGGTPNQQEVGPCHVA
jgi:hypothetical protein